MWLRDRHSPWRSDFLTALRLLGHAAAQQPYGVSETVLCGPAAVALYTGGVGPISVIDVRASNRRVLAAELMALGFRWTERPPRSELGLWHPQLYLVIDITEDQQALTPGECVGLLSVTLDLPDQGTPGARALWVQVIGIEDLIAAQTAYWLGHGVRRDEVLAVVQMLVELGRAGVGSRFRGAYVQRRVALETGGEVTLDPQLIDGIADISGLRVISLSEMAGIIESWGARHGLAGSSITPARPDRRRRTIPRRSGDTEPGGGQIVQLSAKVIPFGAVPVGPPRSG